jgi:RNA polymerase sigma-70 factor (ECF subfamily)
MAASSNKTLQIQGWIDRLQAGDESAREGLLKCACERLERLTRKMLQSFPRVKRWEETGDVFQDAALRLYRTLKDITPKDVREFFRLAALNVRRALLDLAKHYCGPEGQDAHHATWNADSDRTGGDVPQPADDTCDPARLALWTEFHKKVDALPDEDREVFDLLWYQGLSQAEAAEVLGVSERTIKRRWQAARLALHKALGGQMPDA